jgi:hypothetical protein
MANSFFLFDQEKLPDANCMHVAAEFKQIDFAEIGKSLQRFERRWPTPTVR